MRSVCVYVCERAVKHIILSLCVERTAVFRETSESGSPSSENPGLSKALRLMCQSQQSYRKADEAFIQC